LSLDEPVNVRAADTIVRYLEQKIRNGELEDKKPLPTERELMSQFSASRTVVREAITNLTSRRLIENRPRFRPTVKKPDVNSIVDITSGIADHFVQQPSGVKSMYETRIFVERLLVRDAAAHAKKDDINALSRALKKNKECIDDAESFYQSDMALHSVLYQIPRNPIYPALNMAYQNWFSPHWHKIKRPPDRNYVSYRSHEGIVRAIIDRDPDAAEKALTIHLNSAWEYLRVVVPNS